jgi:hypothetical protein
MEGQHMTKNRKQPSAEFKFQLALEAANEAKTSTQLAREQGGIRIR